MSTSVAIAQTTVALCDMLHGALQRDSGWQLTGAVPRVTTLPRGKLDDGGGPSLNVALVAVAPGAEPPSDDASYDLRYLVTAHAYSPLHSELLIGGALQALRNSPTLAATTDRASNDRLRGAVARSIGRIGNAASRVAIEGVDAVGARDCTGPALFVTVSHVVAAADTAPALLLQ